MPDKYDVDYSRFADVEDSDDEIEELWTSGAKAMEPPPGTSRSNKPMPPELAESMRLMQVARATGDKAKLRRAEELAKQAIEKDPVLRQNVQAVQQLDTNRSYTAIYNAAQSPLEKAKSVTDNINRLKADMQAQLNKLKQQEQMLNGKNEAIKDCQSPEQMAAFMEAEGFTHEDIDMAFSGDPEAAAEVLKKHCDQTMPDLNSSSHTHQEQILRQVHELGKQLTKLDDAEEKMKRSSEKRHGRGKKGRGKKGRGGKSKEIDVQKTKLEAMRAKLQNKLQAQALKVAQAERKQAQVKAELIETQEEAKRAAAKVDDSVAAAEASLQNDSDSDSDDEDVAERKRNLKAAKEAQAYVKQQQSRLDSGEEPEELDISTNGSAQPSAKIQGDGWGAGFFKKENQQARAERVAQIQREKEEEKKKREAAKKAAKEAAVRASVERAFGLQKAEHDKATRNTAVLHSKHENGSSAPTDIDLNLGDDDVDADTLMQEAAALMEESKMFTEVDSTGPETATIDTTPEYQIKRLKDHRISVVILLPELESMVGVDLDVSESQMKLIAAYTNKVHEKRQYVLTVNCTEKLEQSRVTAKFNKKKRELKVVIPSGQEL
jgi:hypothetical protein